MSKNPFWHPLDTIYEQKIQNDIEEVKEISFELRLARQTDA